MSLPSASSPPNREELRAACDASLYNFVKIIGGYVKQGADICPEIHGRHCDFSDSPDNFRSGNLMPRIWRKSTIFTKWRPIRDYLLNPDMRGLIVSENQPLGTRFMSFIKHQLMLNKMLRWLYEEELEMLTPSWLQRKLKTGSRPRWGGTQIDLPKENYYSEASLSVIGILGASQSGHYDKIYLDDIIGKKAMESKAVMNGVYTWLDNMQDLLVEPDITHENPSSIHVTGTHWAPGDAYCYMQEKMPEFLWLITPALKDDSLHDTPNIAYIQHPRVEAGECNFPEVYSTEYYHKMRDDPETSMIFWCQQQNNPAKAIALTKFDVGWLRYFRRVKRGDGLYFECLNDGEFVAVDDIDLIGLYDPGGFTDKDVTKRASRNALLIGGKQRGGRKKFIAYTYAEKLRTPKDFIAEFFRLHEEWRPRHWRVETIAAQEWIYKDLVDARNDRGMEGEISIIPLEISTTKDTKDDDILSLVTPMSKGEIYIEEGMDHFKTEVMYYPIGMTRDLIDLAGKLNRNYWIFGDDGETEQLNRTMREKHHRRIISAQRPYVR